MSARPRQTCCATVKQLLHGRLRMQVSTQGRGYSVLIPAGARDGRPVGAHAQRAAVPGGRGPCGAPSTWASASTPRSMLGSSRALRATAACLLARPVNGRACQHACKQGRNAIQRVAQPLCVLVRAKEIRDMLACIIVHAKCAGPVLRGLIGGDSRHQVAQARACSADSSSPRSASRPVPKPGAAGSSLDG